MFLECCAAVYFISSPVLKPAAVHYLSRVLRGGGSPAIYPQASRYREDRAQRPPLDRTERPKRVGGERCRGPPAEMAENWKNCFEEELICPICLHVFVEPVQLPCKHNFCRGCIGEAWAKESGLVRCPECNQAYNQKPNLEKNLKLTNIVEKFNSLNLEKPPSVLHCVFCRRGPPLPAQKICLRCEAPCCQSHVQTHLQQPSTARGHLLVEADDVRAWSCPQHNAYRLYHCEAEQVAVCQFCCYYSGAHQGHSVCDVEIRRNEIRVSRTPAEARVCPARAPPRCSPKPRARAGPAPSPPRRRRRSSSSRCPRGGHVRWPSPPGGGGGCGCRGAPRGRGSALLGEPPERFRCRTRGRAARRRAEALARAGRRGPLARCCWGAQLLGGRWSCGPHPRSGRPEMGLPRGTKRPQARALSLVRPVNVKLPALPTTSLPGPVAAVPFPPARGALSPQAPAASRCWALPCVFGHVMGSLLGARGCPPALEQPGA